MKLDPCISLVTNSNSKSSEELNVTPQSMKLLKENMREILQDIGLGKDFLGITLNAQTKKKQPLTNGITSN
jgi:hypothetical protein